VTCEIEVGGRTRNVEARGPEIFLDGQRVPVDVARSGHAWSLILGQRSYEVAVVEHAAGDLTVHVNGRPIAVRSVRSLRFGHGGPQGPALRARGGQGGEQRDEQSGEQGIRAERTRSSPRADVAGHGPQRVVAPMPGRIAKVLVKVGDAVAARQGLVVVEAMKMENELRSPRAGTVTEVPAVEGALVKANMVLVVVE
jgi:biotin carboxyl carrier protein